MVWFSDVENIVGSTIMFGHSDHPVVCSGSRIRVDGHSFFLRVSLYLSPLVLALCFCIALLVNTVHAQGDERGWKRVDRPSAVYQEDTQPLYKGSHALLIGVSDYESWPRLSSIPLELNAVQLELEAQHFEVNRLVDPDERELKQGIESFIDEFGYDPDNRLLIFFSGHGHSIGNKGFILPVDTPLPTKKKSFRRKALPMTQVLAWARDIESKHVMFVFDSCFSGTVFSSKSIPSIGKRYIRKATNEPVRQFITAGGEDDEVPAKSTFTPMFVRALQGEGDMNGDGYVTGSELGLHLAQQVPRHVDQTPQYGKIPDYSLSKGDFVFELNKPISPNEYSRSHQDSQTDTAILSTVDKGYEFELELWRSAKEFGGREHYEAYLQQYPDGSFAGIAEVRIASLKKQQTLDIWQQLPSAGSTSKRSRPTEKPAVGDVWNPVSAGASLKYPSGSVSSSPINHGWVEIESVVQHGLTDDQRIDDGWVDIK